MAAALSVSSAYLSALEHGKRGKPTWFLVQRIITYFNVIWDEAEEIQRLAELSDPARHHRHRRHGPEGNRTCQPARPKIGGLSDASLEGLLHQLRVAAAKDDI
jgi:transcriptional regulator with XRE-family HTH domain